VCGEELLAEFAGDSDVNVADRRDAALARLTSSRDEARERLARDLQVLADAHGDLSQFNAAFSPSPA